MQHSTWLREVVKALLQDNNHQIPKNAQNQEMCLSYHVKAICNMSCKGTPGHRSHTMEKHVPLFVFCLESFPAIA
jgi:phosphatidylinositol kinase/protein kinase (PI-3  family)